MVDVPPPSPSDELPRPSSALVLAVRGLLLLFVVFVTLGFAAQVAHIPFGLWFTQLALFLGLTACLVRRSGRDPLRYPGLTWIGRGPLVVGFALGVANFLAVIAPLQYLTFLLLPEHVQDTTDRLIFERQSSLQLALVVGAVTLAAPLCEEYFFRGVFQQGLRRAGAGPLAAVLVSAGVFSLFHMQPMKLLPLFELGILFGLLRQRTGSLWPAIAAHSGNNAVTAFLFLSSGGAQAQAPEEMPSPGAIAVVAGVGGLLLLLVVWAARRRPSLMPAHPLPPEPPALPPVPAGRLYGAWVAAMAAAVALLLLVDVREVRLNLFDFTHGLPPLPESAPAMERDLREGLEALRARAERGEAPLEEYFEARRRLAPGGLPPLEEAPPVPGLPPAQLAPSPGQ